MDQLHRVAALRPAVLHPPAADTAEAQAQAIRRVQVQAVPVVILAGAAAVLPPERALAAVPAEVRLQTIQATPIQEVSIRAIRSLRMEGILRTRISELVTRQAKVHGVMPIRATCTWAPIPMLAM